MGYYSIVISDNTISRLKRLKKNKKLVSYNKVIEFLLNEGKY